MGWKSAFLDQAESDYRVLKLLDQFGAEGCHRLHYLQMATEKLAKGFLLNPEDTDPPVATHAVFVSMMQTLRTRPDVRRRLGFKNTTIFDNYIRSLLDLANRIEDLAPSKAGFSRPNPEYPWMKLNTTQVTAPVSYSFPGFDPRSILMKKLDSLIRAVLKLEGRST